MTSPPKLGRLVRRLPDNSTQNVSMFTQSMVGSRVHLSVVAFVPAHAFTSPPQVNHGVVLYDQKQPESVGWSAADSFSFTVSSPPAVLPPHTFTILISYQANEHQDSLPRTRLLNNAGAVAEQRLASYSAETSSNTYFTCVLETAEVFVSVRRSGA